jgi:hypothetical protein
MAWRVVKQIGVIFRKDQLNSGKSAVQGRTLSVSHKGTTDY